MTEYVKVICCGTADRPHSSTELGTIVLHDDGTVDMMNTRQRPAPWAPTDDLLLTGEGVEASAPSRVIETTNDHRADFAGRKRWRLPCERCGRDQPLNETTAAEAASGLVALGRRVLNLSLT